MDIHLKNYILISDVIHLEDPLETTSHVPNQDFDRAKSWIHTPSSHHSHTIPISFPQISPQAFFCQLLSYECWVIFWISTHRIISLKKHGKWQRLGDLRVLSGLLYVTFIISGHGIVFGSFGCIRHHHVNQLHLPWHRHFPGDTQWSTAQGCKCPLWRFPES